MVGIEEMPYFIAIAPSSSVFNLTIFNLSPCSLEISSKIGPTAQHGPHHSAQKSTNTGVVLFKTTCSKSAAVTLVVAIIFSFLLLYFISSILFFNCLTLSIFSAQLKTAQHLELLGNQSQPQ